MVGYQFTLTASLDIYFLQNTIVFGLKEESHIHQGWLETGCVNYGIIFLGELTL